jgi:hypothetical protein
VTHGTSARDWISDRLTERELTPYFGPGEAELDAAGVLAVFLGYYLEWDPETTRLIAAQHGFLANRQGPRTGLYDYADIDDDFISIHHWLKWYKFGFTRLFDNLSLEIRNGRMTREQAVSTVRARGDETPREDIAKLCEFLGISSQRFFEIAETFRNRDIWAHDGGAWKMPGFLVPEWDWNGSGQKLSA